MIERLFIAISLAATALLLAACGGSQPPVGATGTTTQREENSTISLSGESLIAKDIKLSESCTEYFETSFTAKGQATGPYPGTFTATGSWYKTTGEYSVPPTLNEQFTITSGSTNISGSISAGEDHRRGNCGAFRAARAKYFWGKVVGRATVSISKHHFKAQLQGRVRRRTSSL
jgi:hypothetical protein